VAVVRKDTGTRAQQDSYVQLQCKIYERVREIVSQRQMMGVGARIASDEMDAIIDEEYRSRQ